MHPVNNLERTPGQAIPANSFRPRIPAQTPQDIAQVIAAIVAEDDPKFRYQTGERSTMFAGMSLIDIDGSVVTTATGSWVS